MQIRIMFSKWVLCASLFTHVLNCFAYSELTAKPGDDVLLSCQVPRYHDILLLKWSRSDLQTEDLVFFFRDNHFYEDFQHPSYHGRVELRDPEMKDGDASLILENVNFNDAGTYECHVRITGRHGLDLFSSIELIVKFSDPLQIKVKTGEDVILPCQHPRGADIKLLMWRRTDLMEDICVWLHGTLLVEHSSFYGRVELKDPQMKDGDASLILENINFNDAGTYECYVHKTFQRRLINTIILMVDNSDDFPKFSETTWDWGKVVVIVSLSVVIAVHFISLVCLIHKKCKELRNQNLNQTPADQAGDLELHELNDLEGKTNEEETTVET